MNRTGNHVISLGIVLFVLTAVIQLVSPISFGSMYYNIGSAAVIAIATCVLIKDSFANND